MIALALEGHPVVDAIVDATPQTPDRLWLMLHGDPRHRTSYYPTDGIECPYDLEEAA